MTGGGSAGDAEKTARIVGHEGEQTGQVYKITVGRDDLQLTEMGATINARMGLNTWAAFVGSDNDAALAEDVAVFGNRGNACPEGTSQERP